jgi:hypothetical protein
VAEASQLLVWLFDRAVTQENFKHVVQTLVANRRSESEERGCELQTSHMARALSPSLRAAKSNGLVKVLVETHKTLVETHIVGEVEPTVLTDECVPSILCSPVSSLVERHEGLVETHVGDAHEAAGELEHVQKRCSKQQQGHIRSRGTEDVSPTVSPGAPRNPSQGTLRYQPEEHRVTLVDQVAAVAARVAAAEAAVKFAEEEATVHTSPHAARVAGYAAARITTADADLMAVEKMVAAEVAKAVALVEEHGAHAAAAEATAHEATWVAAEQEAAAKVAAAARAVAGGQTARVVARREKLKVVAACVSARIVAEKKSAVESALKKTGPVTQPLPWRPPAATASAVAGSAVAGSAVAVGATEAAVSNVPSHKPVKPAVLEPQPAPGPVIMRQAETVAGAKDDTAGVLPFRDHGPAWPTAARNELTGTQWLVELTLHAITAPSEELAEKCVELAQQLSAKLSAAEVEKAQKVAVELSTAPFAKPDTDF